MRCLAILVIVCPVLATGTLLLDVETEAVKHGLWAAGRRMASTSFYTCTLPIAEPVDKFYLSVNVESRPHTNMVWGLDHMFTVGEGFDETVLVFQSKRTMYPPRIVMPFHFSFIRLRMQPNVTCVFSSTPPAEPPLISPPRSTSPSPTPLFLGGHKLPRGRRQAFIPPEFSENQCDLLESFLPIEEEMEATTTTESPTTTESTFINPNNRLPLFPPGLIIPSTPYQDAIDMSMNFYMAQRSGLIEPVPSYSPVQWMRPSGLNHIAPNGDDLIGGWYTGNDLVKLNLPMASSVTLLAWGHHLWKNSYSHIYPTLYDSLKWPLEYFIKCWNPITEKLYVQVGDFNEDRQIWQRADNVVFENLVTQNKWPFLAASADKPASDVAAEMSSAMMSSFISFGDFSFAGPDEFLGTLYTTGKQLYHFAAKYEGAYSDSFPPTNSEFPNYVSSGYKDELCLAAMWIYEVEFNETYLEAAKDYFEEAETHPYELSWDNKYPACAVLLAKETNDFKYSSYIEKFLSSWIHGNFTEGGLAYHSEKGTLRYTANAALVALLADEYGIASNPIKSKQRLEFAVDQINYMLGVNPQKFSYLIGYGENYPKNPTHKNSACPHPAKRCGWDFYQFTSFSNVNELHGALVGGPDKNDEFTDIRTEKIANSVAIDYNAGFQSALAGVSALKERITNRCSTNPETTTQWLETMSTEDWSTEARSSTTTTTSTTSTTQTTKYTTTQSTGVPVQPTSFAFGEALGNSNLFYMAQRHGAIPENYPITWRYTDTYVFQLAGGWFDDGTQIRTTIAMASAATLLGWGGLQFKEGYQRAGEMENLYANMRVPLQYFLNMWNSQQTLYIKNTMEEIKYHAFWTRPEDYLMELKIFDSPYRLVTGGSGADILAEVVTALTIGSKLFEEIDGEFAAEMLTIAEVIFENITDYNGVFEDENSWNYHGNRGETDELCLSAAWLYKVTNKDVYKSKASAYVQTDYEKVVSWNNKHVLCEMLLYEIVGYNTYRRAVKGFLDHWVDGGVGTTPQGLAWHSEQGTLRYTANTAFVALLAADMGIGDGKHREWAKSQVEYMLGKNNNAYSYQVGYGNRFPRRPHHRGSSCPEYIDPCDWSIYNAPGPNPHVLIGALVSGPDRNDYFEDARTNYTMSRVAVDYNAGFQSVLAGLVKVYGVSTTTTTTQTEPPPTPKTTAVKVPVIKPSTTQNPTKVPSSKQTADVGKKKTPSPTPVGVTTQGVTSPADDQGTSKGSNNVYSVSLLVALLQIAYLAVQY